MHRSILPLMFFIFVEFLVVVYFVLLKHCPSCQKLRSHNEHGLCIYVDTNRLVDTRL